MEAEIAGERIWKSCFYTWGKVGLSIKCIQERWKRQRPSPTLSSSVASWRLTENTIAPPADYHTHAFVDGDARKGALSRVKILKSQWRFVIDFNKNHIYELIVSHSRRSEQRNTKYADSDWRAVSLTRFTCTLSVASVHKFHFWHCVIDDTSIWSQLFLL